MGSDLTIGFLAFLANGASPQQAIKVVMAAMLPVIRPIWINPLAPSEITPAAITRPLKPAKIEPVNLAALSLVLIAVFSVSSVDKAAYGRLTPV